MRRDDIPLFPLNAVLFPGSRLRLRVFEPRYFDMLRECGRRGIGFGVVCILDGVEAGPPAIPAAYGSLVRIEDFGHTEDGLLGLTVEAEARFHAHRTRRATGARAVSAATTKAVVVSSIAVLAADYVITSVLV